MRPNELICLRRGHPGVRPERRGEGWGGVPRVSPITTGGAQKAPVKGTFNKASKARGLVLGRNLELARQETLK